MPSGRRVFQRAMTGCAPFCAAVYDIRSSSGWQWTTHIRHPAKCAGLHAGHTCHVRFSEKAIASDRIRL